MHNNRNKKHVREDDVMLPALAHEKHHAMGVQLLIDLIDLKRAGRSAACSAQTGSVDDSRHACFHAAKQVWEMKGGHWQCEH